MLTFNKWREMAGVSTIVSKKDCKHPDFQVWGSFCKKSKISESNATDNAAIEEYEKVNWLNLPKGWHDWTDMQKLVHMVWTAGQNANRRAAAAKTPQNADSPTTSQQTPSKDSPTEKYQNWWTYIRANKPSLES